jgi:hypothetical protein
MLLAASSFSGSTNQVAHPPPGARGYLQLPLSFEPNRGQTDASVHYFSHGNGYRLFLTPSEAVFDLRKTVLRMKFAGANPAAQLSGVNQLRGKSNYFRGKNPAEWRVDIPTYSRVQYQNIYPGIDLVCYGDRRRLEYDFVIAPGIDPQVIKLDFAGPREMRLDRNGDLVFRDRWGEIRQHKPVAYQRSNGTKRYVPSRYVIRGKHSIGFAVGEYDSSKPLVIDPVLAYSTYLGGSGADTGYSIALDVAGNAYVTGGTDSTNFPTSLNPLQPANAGLTDAFVLKLDPAGSSVIYSTYLGGSGNENDFNQLTGVEGAGIAVDASGSAYLTGRTASLDFPVVGGAFTSFRGPDYDAFFVKLSPEGNSIVYSTYLGGSANDSGEAVAVDGAGNAYVIGGTRSLDFPTTLAAFQTSNRGLVDVFVTKIDPTLEGLASLVYSTYLGGDGRDRGAGIKVDSAGNAYITGRTESPNFPLRNPLQPTLGGMTDIFVAKLNPGGTDLVYSTYIGGSALDAGTGIALDSAGNVYVIGETASTNFPTVNGFQTTNGGGSDAFVLKLNAAGSAIFYSTYLGGAGLDRATGVALDSAGSVFITGETASSNFPTKDPLQASNGGGSDAFVAKLDLSAIGAASLIYSSYLGGASKDIGFSVAVNSGGAWVTGQTASTNFPTIGALQASFGGGSSDAFIARIAETSATPDFALSATPASQTVSPGASTTYTITAIPSGGFTGTISLTATGLPADATASFVPPTITISGPAPQSSVLTVATAATTPPGSFPLTVTATSGTLQHTASVSLVVQITATPDFALSAVPDAQTIGPGASTTYTVTATPSGGFTGTINLAVTGVPADASASFQPPVIAITDPTPQSSVMTVMTAVTTPADSFPLTITATSGTLQHTATVTLTLSSDAGAGDLF